MNTLFAYLIEFSLHLPPLRIHPRRPSPAFSRSIALFHPSLTLRIRRTRFCSFRTLTAFHGLILAGLAQSQHSTVAVWQLFLSAFSHAAPAPRSRVQSYFCYFRTLYPFDGRILAGFAPSLHSTVAFSQLFLSALSHPAPAPRSSIRSHFCRFRSLSAFNGRILTGFAQSPNLTVAFWQFFLTAFAHPAPAP